MKSPLWMLVPLSAVACAHVPLSATQLRTDAAVEEQAAEVEEQQYDPHAMAMSTLPAGLSVWGESESPEVARVSNPTASHLYAAERHRRRAERELHQAAALDRKAQTGSP